jgi:hypothetical protein
MRTRLADRKLAFLDFSVDWKTGRVRKQTNLSGLIRGRLGHRCSLQPPVGSISWRGRSIIEVDPGNRTKR